MHLFLDRKFRLPRIWSNSELKKFSSLFSGSVINVSAWQDSDKEGNKYRDYFLNCREYYISNYKTDQKGIQGYENEIFLDIEEELPTELYNKYDVVYNHTVLEHVFNVQTAFKNLCLLSKDIVIIVVPFLQQMHEDFGDYWRFTPLTVRRLFSDNGYKLLYLSFNSHKNASVYIFAIASKSPEKWGRLITDKFSYLVECKTFDGFGNMIGCRSINNYGYLIKRLFIRLRSLFRPK
jgi:hypothetical protein